MSAKEKAIELVDKMSSQTYSYQPYAGAHYNIEEIGYEAGKKCALISVDEMLNSMSIQSTDECQYWEEVKQEIINL
jgi:hypothetical protein